MPWWPSPRGSAYEPLGAGAGAVLELFQVVRRLADRARGELARRGPLEGQHDDLGRLAGELEDLGVDQRLAELAQRAMQVVERRL